MSETKPMVWASDEKANISEPIEALKQRGWGYGDVPAASNFNWLFKELALSDQNLNARVDKTSADLKTQLEQTHSDLRLLRGYVRAMYDLLMAIRSRLTEQQAYPPLPHLFINWPVIDRRAHSDGPIVISNDAGTAESGHGDRE